MSDVRAAVPEPLIRVGVVGARGRMGRLVCEAVQAQGDLELGAEIARGEPLDLLRARSCDVVVDFTNPDVIWEHARWYVENALHAIIGTTGLRPDQVRELGALIAARGDRSNLMVISNFSVSAALMHYFALVAARFLPDAEIIEITHARKADAPGGAVIATAQAIAAARTEAPVPPFGREHVAGARGADVDGVRVHSLRLNGFTSHLEVIFGGPGQALTIQQDNFDRPGFMPGVLLAIRNVARHPGVTLGMGPLLGLPSA
jgi:4-hydroxy-tetrahydrodipicolinate reductase